MIRVSVFEDNKHLRETFKLLLSNADGFTCSGAYPDCKTLVADLEVAPCDIVLMDIEMPGMKGIEATKIIKEHFPEINILIQTVFFDDDYIFNAICAGASGYILKSTTPDGYLEAIRDVQTGGSPMTPQLARRLVQFFNASAQNPEAARVSQLTTDERAFLGQLANGYTYKEIAAAMKVSIDNVRSYVRTVYEKLHVHSRTEAVVKYLRAEPR